MSNNTALNDALAAAATQASADPSQVAQPISQEQGEAYQATSLPAATTQNAVAQAPAAQPVSALSMHSSVVQSQSSISDFFKLRDGGCLIDDVKYPAVLFRLRLESSEKGGGFKPCYMMNYENSSGMVYTKSYDGVTTTSNNPAHSALSWADNKAKILQTHPKSYDFLGYDLALVVAEDVESLDGKQILKAGTVLGYTTPYTAAKKIKKVWDDAVGTNNLGKDALLLLSGEEVTKNNRQYKMLVVEAKGYAEPKVFEIEHEDVGE